MEELGYGPQLVSRVSDDYVKGVMSCFPTVHLQQAHNPPKEQLSFSVIAVVIANGGGGNAFTVSDLMSTGSTERKLLLQGEAKSYALEVGDVLLLLNPVGDTARLTVNTARHIVLVAKLPDLRKCAKINCQKPVVPSRDGNVCWQHAINATAAANVRSDTAGGILTSTSNSQISKIYSASTAPKAPKKDPKKAQQEALEAKKKNLLWLQERMLNPKTSRERMMQAANCGKETENVTDSVLVKAGDADIEIEFEEDPKKTAPAMCEIILPALPSAEEKHAEPKKAEPPKKKQRVNDESMKLTLPTFSSDEEDENNPILALTEEQLDQIRANYR